MSQCFAIWFKKIKNTDVTLKLIREVHALLLKNSRGKTKSPGEFRKLQKWID
jgi:hypothetical protein